MTKWLLVGIALMLALAVGFLAALPLLVGLPAVRLSVTHALAHAFGRPVRYGSLSVIPFPRPSIRIRELAVSDDPRFGSGPVLTAREGRIGVRLPPLLSGRVELTDLVLDGLVVNAIEDAGGRWNLAGLGAGAAASRGPGQRPASAGGSPSVSPARITVNGGAFVYQRRGPRPVEISLREVALSAEAANRPDEFELSGTATLDPGGLRLSIARARLGPVPARGLADAPLRAVVDLDLPDVAPLIRLLMSSPALSGPATGSVAVDGPLARLGAAGDVRIPRLVAAVDRPHCPPPRLRRLELHDVRLPIRYARGIVEIAPAQARLAGGTVSARLALRGDVLTLREIDVRGVGLQAVLADYLCRAHALTGALDLQGDASMRVGDPIHSLGGAGAFRLGGGQVVGTEARDALTELTRIAGATGVVSARTGPALAPSPLRFDSIVATYRIDGGVARTEDLRYEGEGFTVLGSGTYALLDGRLEMQITLRQGANQVHALLSSAGPGRVRIVPVSARVPNLPEFRRFIDRMLR